MNIQKELSKLYNVIKYLQISEDEITAENVMKASYYAGMQDSAKMFMNIYNGDLTQHQVDVEIAKLKESSAVVN